MATKTISITEEAYERLASLKEKNESFSRMINRKFKEYNLLDMAGALSKKSANKLEKAIKENRKKDQKIYDEKIKEVGKKLKG